jgi:hypothetical protein
VTNDNAETRQNDQSRHRKQQTTINSATTYLVEGGSHWMQQWTLQIHHHGYFGCCGSSRNRKVNDLQEVSAAKSEKSS